MRKDRLYLLDTAIDVEAAWSAVEKDLPQFRRQMEAIVAALPPQE